MFTPEIGFNPPASDITIKLVVPFGATSRTSISRGRACVTLFKVKLTPVTVPGKPANVIFDGYGVAGAGVGAPDARSLIVIGAEFVIVAVGARNVFICLPLVSFGVAAFFDFVSNAKLKIGVFNEHRIKNDKQNKENFECERLAFVNVFFIGKPFFNLIKRALEQIDIGTRRGRTDDVY